MGNQLPWRVSIMTQQENLTSLERFKNSKESNIEVIRQEMQSGGLDKTEGDRKISTLESEIRLARDPIQADMDERKRLQINYAETIKQTIQNDVPVFFHGVRSCGSVQFIIESGHLGYTCEQKSSSFTASGKFDASTVSCCYETIDGYIGLGNNKHLPAGCMFVILPKDDKEQKRAREPNIIGVETLYFNKEPERILAIASTNENIEYLRSLLKSNGYSQELACSFDEFPNIYKEYVKKRENAIKMEYLKEEYNKLHILEIKSGRSPKDTFEDFCKSAKIDNLKYEEWKKSKQFDNPASPEATKIRKQIAPKSFSTPKSISPNYSR